METELPSVEIIIVTWNTPELIKENVEDIIEHTTYPDYHITIIDNCSIDKTWNVVRELCYKHPTKIHAFQNHINHGYGTACNIGTKLSNSEYIIFLNSDVHTHPDCPGWIEAMIDAFDVDDDVGVVGPKMLSEEGLVNGAAVLGTNKDNDMEWYWQQEDDGRFDKMLDAITLCGACIMMPRDVFAALGGFDVRYRHYYEEKALIYRARMRGLRVLYQPKSVIVHAHMGSCDQQNVLGVFEHNGRTIFEEDFKEFIEETGGE